MTVKFQPKLTVPTSLPASRPTQAASVRVGPNAQRQNERSTFEPPAIRYTGRPVLNPPRLPGSPDSERLGHRPPSYTGQPHGPFGIPGAPGIVPRLDLNPNTIPGAPGIVPPIGINPNAIPGAPGIVPDSGHVPGFNGPIDIPLFPRGIDLPGQPPTGIVPDEHCPHHASPPPVSIEPPVGIVPDGVIPGAPSTTLFNEKPVGIVPDGVDPLVLARHMATFRG